ncbi:unnamed protein product [Calypogeia fissa]
MSHRHHRDEVAVAVRLRGFYNLPSDEAQGYPRFSSFEDRENFIKSSVLQSPEFAQGLEKLVESDSKISQALASSPDDHDGDGHMGNESMQKGTKQWVFPRVLKLVDHKQLSDVVFVGSSTALFSPNRGDLVISPPGKDQALCKKGYVASYKDCNTHRFKHGELLVRIGQYEEIGPSLFGYQPYRNLELHQYNMDGRWKYLGSQVAMTNTEIPIDTSPGKYLKVGAQIAKVDRFHPLVPRRGDIIIKREAWDENFFHQKNFRHSMIKWHRDCQITWNSDDLLIRLFVDKEKHPLYSYVSKTTPEPGDHSACVMHGKCEKSHPPPSSGFAELYGCRQGAVGWVYWGRTKLLFDIPVPNSPEDRDPHLAYYVTNDGQLSDFEVEEDQDDTEAAGLWTLG